MFTFNEINFENLKILCLCTYMNMYCFPFTKKIHKNVVLIIIVIRRYCLYNLQFDKCNNLPYNT